MAIAWEGSAPSRDPEAAQVETAIQATSMMDRAKRPGGRQECLEPGRTVADSICTAAAYHRAIRGHCGKLALTPTRSVPPMWHDPDTAALPGASTRSIRRLASRSRRIWRRDSPRNWGRARASQDVAPAAREERYHGASDRVRPGPLGALGGYRHCGGGFRRGRCDGGGRPAAAGACRAAAGGAREARG